MDGIRARDARELPRIRPPLIREATVNRKPRFIVCPLMTSFGGDGEYPSEGEGLVIR